LGGLVAVGVVLGCGSPFASLILGAVLVELLYALSNLIGS
jgi:hypothetical protein